MIEPRPRPRLRPRPRARRPLRSSANFIHPFQKLDVYIAAKKIARLVNEARITHTELRDQAQRASISCFLQLAEGLPNQGPGMRRKYFTESNNSLHELVAAVDLACTLGALSTERAQAIQELGVRTKRMLRALLNLPAA